MTRGARAGLRVKCFGCDFTADALGLVAEVYGLDVAREFPAVLERAGALVGHARPSRARPPAHDDARMERAYPPLDEVLELLASGCDVVDDDEANALVRTRGLEPWRVDELRLARVLPREARLPAWARFQGRSWTQTGHRLILPVVDACGDIRSVRAWRVTAGDTPKRLPPAAHSAAGLVLACPFARGVLGGASYAEGQLPKIIICEGEPDFLTWVTMFSDANECAPVVVGVVAGSWDASIAARIPVGARVVIRTHHDEAGERYAQAIARSLPNRDICRSRPSSTRVA